MKTEKSLKGSRRARIKDVENISDLICDQAALLRHRGFDGEVMAKMRENTNKLVQAVHEYSAYHNALETE